MFQQRAKQGTLNFRASRHCQLLEHSAFVAHQTNHSRLESRSWRFKMNSDPRSKSKQSLDLDSAVRLRVRFNSQLHPWLVPHSMQTPHAPARMTLSLPQTEQVIPMKILPSATVTRSAESLSPLPFPWIAAGSLEDLFVITSITSLSSVRAKSVTGRFRAFFSISAISLSGKSG